MPVFWCVTAYNGRELISTNFEVTVTSKLHDCGLIEALCMHMNFLLIGFFPKALHDSPDSTNGVPYTGFYGSTKIL